MPEHAGRYDYVLTEKGRDPATVGILFSTTLIVGATEQEAKAKKEALLDMLPPEAVGAYLSIATTLAIFAGGIVRWMIDNWAAYGVGSTPGRGSS